MMAFTCIAIGSYAFLLGTTFITADIKYLDITNIFSFGKGTRFGILFFSILGLLFSVIFSGKIIHLLNKAERTGE
jgi:hypothetical protein